MSIESIPFKDSVQTDLAATDALRAVKRQNKRLKHVIRKFLTADTLTAAQRQELISVLAGLEDGRGRGYPLHTELSDAEVRLLQRFRTLRPESRRVVTRMVKQLSKKGGV